MDDEEVVRVNRGKIRETQLGEIQIPIPWRRWNG